MRWQKKEKNFKKKIFKKIMNKKSEKNFQKELTRKRNVAITTKSGKKLL